jgi:outer membrane protein
MKNLRLIIATMVLLAGMSFSASAQTKQKIFTNYWKTKQANVALDNRQTELVKEMKDMTEGLDKAQADYKQLLDQANDPAISAEERDKRKQAAAAKAQEINTDKTSVEQFQQQAKAQLADETQRMRGNLLTEIQKAVADKAKVGGYTMVINSAITDAFLYVGPQSDITDAVLAQLNAGAPIDLPAPASGSGTNLR